MAKKLLVYLFSFFGRKSKVKQQKKFINEIKVFLIREIGGADNDMEKALTTKYHIFLHD